MKKSLIIKTIMAVVLLLFVGLAVNQIRQDKQVKLQNQIELKSREAKLIELDNNLRSVLDEKAETEAQRDEQNKKIQELEADRQRLEAELQAKRERTRLEQEKLATAAKKAQGLQRASAAPAGPRNCGDNPHKQFIYQHESGCRLDAVNSRGCRGIGQACPGSKLPCGADFACQDAWFSNYAVSRYGGWPQAHQAWLRQGWW